MPRNKKNKNRAAPTPQAANAPAVIVPVKPTEISPPDAPTQKSDVVATPVVDQPIVALASAIVEPIPVAVKETKSTEAPASIISETVTDRTSDDDETAGMSKSQKKKKNKNKNKGNKFGPETNVTLAEPRVAAKLEPEEKQTTSAISIVPDPVEKVDKVENVEKVEIVGKVEKVKNNNKIEIVEKVGDKVIEKPIEQVDLKPSTNQNRAAVRPEIVEKIDEKPNDSKKIDPEPAQIQQGKSKNKKNKNKNKNEVICEENLESLDIVKEDSLSKACEISKDEPVKVEKKSEAEEPKSKPEEKSKTEENPIANENPKAEEKPSEIKTEVFKSDNTNKSGNKKKSHDNVKTEETPKLLIKDDVPLKDHKSDNKSSVKEIIKFEDKLDDTKKSDVKPKIEEKKKQDNKSKPAVNKATNKPKAAEKPIEPTCEPIQSIETPSNKIETTEKTQQQVPAKDSTSKKLPSTVTQPKQNKPACPILNPIIPNPDIASIWKILDPPKEDNEAKPLLTPIPLSGPSLSVECKSTSALEQSDILKTSLSVLPQVLSTQFIATPIIADAIATTIDVKPLASVAKEEPSKFDAVKNVDTTSLKQSDSLNIEEQKSIIDDILSKMSEPVLSEPMIPIKMAANCPPTSLTSEKTAVAATVQQPVAEPELPVDVKKITPSTPSTSPPTTPPITVPTSPIVVSAKIGESIPIKKEVMPSQPTAKDVMSAKKGPVTDFPKLEETAKPTVAIPVELKKAETKVPPSTPRPVPIKNTIDTEKKTAAESIVKVDVKLLVSGKTTETPDKPSTDPEKPPEVTKPVVAEPTITAAEESTPVDESPTAPPKKSTTKTEKATKVKPATVAAVKEKPVKEAKIKTSDKTKVTATAEKPVKEPKTKTTKTKAKAPAPPNKDEDVTAKAIVTATTEELAAVAAQSASTSTLADPIQPSVSTDSKNAPGSDSAQSVDVSAIIGSGSAESLRTELSANDSKDVSITADVILSNDVNATFTIPATKSAKGKAAPVEVKKPSVDVQQPTVDDPKTNQLLDLLTSTTEKMAGVKAGAVAGNVRTKTPAKVTTTAAANVAKPSAEPKATKPGSPVKDVAANKPANKPKQPSPPKDVASTSAASPATKPAARSAKTPPRNPTVATPTTANKSRNSPHKEKSPVASNSKPTIQPRPTKTFDKKTTPPPPVNTANQRSASSSSSRASNSPSPNPPYDDDEYVEFKFSPRPVYMSTICQVCKIPLAHHVHCKQCTMVSYCSVEHLTEDADGHQPLCKAIQEIAKKRGGHVYNNARILNDDDYRSLRVHTLNLCENALQRHLQPFEREILLFPRLCATGTCREWRQQLLTECKSCGQVSYCAEHVNHLGASHARWCQAFALYQKLVFTQKKYGRIEPSLPSKIMTKPYQLPATMDETFKSLYKNYGAIKEDCTYAALTQLATAPLTAYYGMQRADMTSPIGERFTIHLVGAELQFEADTLDKWETFFLHLVPQLLELHVTFVGPELNAENLPLEILSRIRMCRACRQNCRAVKFDFQCGMLYHNYVASSAFAKPDLICFFNPGLYRATGFNGIDTWPETIRAAAAQKAPIIVTSYTEVESPRDLERLQREAGAANVGLVLAPHVNPFSSQRPERNFISDEVAPMIFKNYYCFVCK